MADVVLAGCGYQFEQVCLRKENRQCISIRLRHSKKTGIFNEVGRFCVAYGIADYEYTVTPTAILHQ